jgi:hypothetical protein
MLVLQDSEVKIMPGKKTLFHFKRTNANTKTALGNAEQVMTTNDWT